MSAPAIGIALAACLLACSAAGPGSLPSDADPAAPDGGGEDAPYADVLPGLPDAGGEDGPDADVLPAPLTICDGSDGVRFAYVVMSDAGRVGPGLAVIYQNGHNYLFVDGRCRYWAFQGNPRGVLVGARSGVLDRETERRLSEELRTGSWGAWRGTHSTPGGPIHASPEVLWVPGAGIVCKGCFTEMPHLREVIFAARSWLERLQAAGAPLTGAVRLAAINYQESYRDWPHGVALWPVQRPLSDFVVPLVPGEPGIEGPGLRVEGDEAEALRQLRRETLEGKFFPAGAPTPGTIPVRDDNGQLHFLYVRDTLPFERPSDGQVPRPPAPP